MQHKLVRAQHGGLDIKLVVQRDLAIPTKIKGKKGKIYYTEWGKQEDIPLAVFNPKKGTPTKEWLIAGRWE
jgi:hypothetical protein